MVTHIWRAVYPHPPEPPSRTHQDCFEAKAPCRGDAFAFRVTVVEFWTRRGEFDVHDLEYRKVTTRAGVERRLRAVSRRYPPDATGVVEHAMNTQLASPQRFTDDSLLTCAYSVQVMPDEAFAEQLQEVEIERLKADAKHARETQDLDRIEVMQARWLAFLRQLDSDPLGQLAARLAGHQELAKAIEQHTSEQQRITDGLRELCDAATEAYQDKDVFEFVMTTESAISQLLQHIKADSAHSSNGVQ